MKLLRRRLIPLLLLSVIGACGSVATPATDSDPTRVTTVANASDPSRLDDLVDAHTYPARTNTSFFAGAIWDGGAYWGGDLVVNEFTCAALDTASSRDFISCVIAGTRDNPFAFVIPNNDPEYDSDQTKHELVEFWVFQPVPDAAGIRAERVLSGYQDYVRTEDIPLFFYYELIVSTVEAGTAGTSVSLHSKEVGGTRSVDQIEMIGLNEFGTAQVVAMFDGQNVWGPDHDGRGFIFYDNRYAETGVGTCCPSYQVINYFRPGHNGWTHSWRTIPIDEYPDASVRDFSDAQLVASLNFLDSSPSDE